VTFRFYQVKIVLRSRGRAVECGGFELSVPAARLTLAPHFVSGRPCPYSESARVSPFPGAAAAVAVSRIDIRHLGANGRLSLLAVYTPHTITEATGLSVTSTPA